MKAVDSSGQVDALLSTVKSLNEKCESLSKTNSSLRRFIEEERYHERAHSRNAELSNDNGDKAPAYVMQWMAEHGMPWEVFWCEGHQKWHDELDSSFPYYIDNSCEDCRG